ncbi:hypothetical protein J2848_003924 [Azospirillum lipoferum]|uniref:Uncharacterized protein n=1 Tax=Azospirillum lipoferum TaxID=193 RepID=A0A5A9GCZ4_AZOLI|nr:MULTISPECIES: hypothetical protein [Azospirillum]KAA0592266.1 hypothetical protein FZ942_29045 [Azospirillum lipoferum]MCP1612244.1 hypothetical protein [Azospirillum lipoferum]MDW5536534.1 hypothetical protein [Azospirillum sp. NL1]
MSDLAPQEPQPQPEPQALPPHAGDTTGAATPRRGRRRWWILGSGLLLAPLALVGLAVLAVLWTGSQLYDQPFAWYNLNRINAVAERAARTPDSVLVVALGDTALRDATLDERGMAKIAAERGVPNLEFLRIVHRQAQFADFEPLLDRLIAVKPTLILIDRNLLTASRSPVDELQRYGNGLMRLYRGQTYVQDQMALQYRHGCGPTPSAWLTGGSPGAVAGSTATERQVRAFIDRAWAAGIRVALIEVHSRPARQAPSLIATASAAEPASSALPLWNYGGATAAADDDEDAAPAAACDQASAGGRNAFSVWLTGGIAGALAGAQPDRMPGRAAVTEAASLP